MLKSQSLSLRLSEIRSALNALAGAAPGSELSADQLSEIDKLSNEYQDTEARWRAATVAETEAPKLQDGNEPAGETGEGAEVRRLMQTATVHGYVDALLQGRHATGAEGELRDALNAHGGVGYTGDGLVIPWCLLLPEEHRVATSTTQNDGSVRQIPIIDRLWRPVGGLMDMLGVGLMSSGPGQTEYPLVSAGSTNVAQTAEATGIADPSVMTFDYQMLKPNGRLSGSYELTAELRASVVGIEEALRRDLSSLVEERMHEQIISGDGTAPNQRGILTALTAPTTNPTAEAGFSDYIKLPASAVSGYFSSDPTEIDILTAVDVMQHANGVVASGTSEDSWMALRARSKRIKATKFLGDAPTTGGDAGVNKNIILHESGMNGGSMRYDSLGIVWGVGPSLIVDRVQKASSGTTILTWLTIWSCYMGFRDAYRRVALKLTP